MRREIHALCARLKYIAEYRLGDIGEGGYGKPLGSKGGTDLSGLFKIKLKAAGLRIVYKLIRTETEMLIVVIGARADDEVYQIAEKRARKKQL